MMSGRSMGCLRKTSHPAPTIYTCLFVGQTNELRTRLLEQAVLGCVENVLVRHRKPPSQSWRTFLKNHAKNLVSADFFVVPTIAFQLLFVFVILDQPGDVRFISL